MAFRDAGNTEKAIKAVRQALKINKDYAGGYNILGNCFTDRKDYRAALEMYKGPYA
jgi:tetratricopeptide (TPR) repeat protein